MKRILVFLSATAGLAVKGGAAQGAPRGSILPPEGPRGSADGPAAGLSLRRTGGLAPAAIRPARPRARCAGLLRARRSRQLAPNQRSGVPMSTPVGPLRRSALLLAICAGVPLASCSGGG